MLEEIKSFVSVVKEGSFTQAADVLGVSRSVLSKHVSRLEAHTGVRLLNRTTRRLSLTEGGALFYQKSARGLQTLDEAIEEVKSLNQEPRGQLRINMPMSFGILHVAPWIPEFLASYPHVSVDMHFDDREVEMIEAGFDVSIRIMDLQESSLTARRLGPCHHVVVASPLYQSRGLPDTPRALADGHCIASFRYQDSALEWRFEDETGQQLTVPLSAAITADNSLALRQMVLGGAAIARMPTYLVAKDVADGQLINVFPNWKMLTKSIYIVFPQRRFMPSKTRVFIDFLAQKLTDPPGWDLLLSGAGG
ncbi:MAG: LysR family transcriptional regulator [Gammaproteobacteria bacterium]|nr:LysR family transcriptional regulator [Gammaproteobacteria bacterium]